MIFNMVKKLLTIEWKEEKEIVKNELETMLSLLISTLNAKLPDHKRTIKSIMDTLDSLDKPWIIKQAQTLKEVQKSMSLSEIASESSSWQNVNVSWLANVTLFQPALLPVMKVPTDISGGVYNNTEEYFEIVMRLWIGLTFVDGNSNLNPKCRHKFYEKECGQVLLPDSEQNGVYCLNSCFSPVVLSCPDSRHKKGLCCKCAQKAKTELMGPAGPHASTNIYDCWVTKVDYEGRIYMNGVESRKPPYQTGIHWQSSRRLSSANLVGLVKLTNQGFCLNDNDIIIWGEIISHGDPRDEFKRREGKMLCVSIANINDSKLMDHIKKDDYLAVIDCMTFAPERIPVLKALDVQKVCTLPFQKGALLNIGVHKNITNFELCTPKLNTLMDEKMPPLSLPKAFINSLEMIVDFIIIQSQLDPIICIRRYKKKAAKLRYNLTDLLLSATLDRKQLRSFAEALIEPVHLTQGPPGTGKSYLGVVIVRALMIIQKLCYLVDKTFGMPPILVLSYKNHAIDEFLTDLIKSEQNVSLIRIGNTDEPALYRYSEKNFRSSDFLVESLKNDLQLLLKQKDDNQKMLEEFSPLSTYDFFIQTSPQGDGEIKAKKTASYNAASFLNDLIVNVKQLTDFLNHINENGLEYDFEDLKIFWDKLLLKKSSKNINENDIQSLCNGIKHYDNITNLTEVILKWIEGFEPLSKCSFTHPCNNIVCSKHDILCYSHKCILESCRLPHLDNCLYCEYHKNKICSVKDCLRFATSRSVPYCYHHNRVSCSRKNCERFVLSRSEPYCEKHSSRLNIKQSNIKIKCDRCKNKYKYCECRDMSYKVISRVGQSDKNDFPVMINSKNNNNKVYEDRVKSTQRSTIETANDTFFETITIVDDDLCQKQEKSNKESKDIKRKFNKESGKSNCFTHKKDCHEIINNVESFNHTVIDVDDMNDEPANYHHMREVYNFEEIDEGEIEEDTVQTNPNELIILDELEPMLLPENWNWKMSLEERWHQCKLLGKSFHSLLSRLSEIRNIQIKALRKSLHEENMRAKTRVYQRKSVIGGTIVGYISRLEAIRSTKPFAVLIEEASEVLEPLVFSCLADTTCKLEMIGDHLQLKPSVMSNLMFQHKNKINYSMFERLISAPKSHYVPSSVLSTQRRMRKSICDLTRSFYKHIVDIEDDSICSSRKIGDALSNTSRKIVTRKLNSNFFDKMKICSGKGREVPGVLPNIFFWTHEGIQTKAKVGLSRINITEAKMVIGLTEYLVNCGVPKSSIAILTPYKGQLMLIRLDLMKLNLLNNKDKVNSVILSTVDRFQGDEADVVIISLVIDAKSRTGFVKEANRMIVLLSRARLGMYIVGNINYFEEKSDESVHWTNILEKLRQPCEPDTGHEEIHFNGPRIGNKLPICCPVHRMKDIFYAESVEKLNPNLCKEKCLKLLPCMHLCDLSCHFNDSDNHNKHCSFIINPPPCKTHAIKLTCSELYQNVKTFLPFCEAFKSYKCSEKVNVQLPCLHERKISCWEKTLMDRTGQLSELADFVCKESVEIINPDCGHPSIVACFQNQLLLKSNLLIKNPIIEIKEEEVSLHFNKYLLSHKCTYYILLHRKCGHRVKLQCYKVKDKHIQLCLVPIEIINPICGHRLSLPCHLSNINDWKPWKNKICHRFVNNVLFDDCPPPIFPTEKLLKYINKCRDTVIVQRTSCSHQYSINCGVAFNELENKTFRICNEEIKDALLNCGHTKTFTCSSYQIYKLNPEKYLCNEKISMSCWNNSNCNQSQNADTLVKKNLNQRFSEQIIPTDASSYVIDMNVKSVSEKINNLKNISIFDGMNIQANWDGKSLGRTLKNLQNELIKKLQFCISSNSPGSPVALLSGINYLKKLLNQGDHPEIHLLMSLENCKLESFEDAKVELDKYIIAVKRNKTALNPLFLLAKARIACHEQKAMITKELLNQFSKLHPNALKLWCDDDEIRLINDNPSAPLQLALTENYLLDPLLKWNNLKDQEGVTSKAMDELVKMIGLKKVKEFAIDLFKFSLKFAQLDQVGKSANLAKLNFCLLGKGSGKATVARLLAEILKDASLRSSNIFVECSAQKLKDGGLDQFRNLAASAKNGVFFIDKAYDLDPKGDLQGKAIVSELLFISENDREHLSIVLAGNEDDMDAKLFLHDKRIKNHFDIVHFEDSDVSELKSRIESSQCI